MALPAVQREGIQAAVQAARVRTHATRNATVIEVDPTNQVAMVTTDGPEGGPFGADIVAPVALYPGDRVTVLFTPPHGAMVVGRQGGDRDDWHVIGTAGEPQYGSGWAAAAGTTEIGNNGPARLAFTKEGRRVELRGRADRVSGVNNNVFPLPQDYRPENDLLIQAGGNLGGASPITIDRLTGTITVIAGANTLIADGVSFLAAPPVGT